MHSIWEQTTQTKRYAPLSGDRRVEVAVIGAGLAGLLTAKFLQDAGKQVIVLEADQAGSGQTAHTTAKITAQHGCMYASMMGKYGERKTSLYAKAHSEAVNLFAGMIEKDRIDCDFERMDSYLYTEERCGIAMLQKEAEAMARLGLPAYYTNRTLLPFAITGAVCLQGQAQIHPLKFLYALADQETVYENTKVLRVKGHRIETPRGTVTADHIVFACHYPPVNVPGFYFVRQHQERSYVLAFRGIPRWDGMYYGIDSDGLSFRWYRDYLLVGGGGHRTGLVARRPTGSDVPSPKKKQSEYGYPVLRRRVCDLFPDAIEEAGWAAQDCMPHDRMPFIGRYSVFEPDWYVITGLKKWGMTGSMIGAKIISDSILGSENPYQELFAPLRLNMKTGIRDLAEDLRITTRHLLFGQGERIRCPHLGCVMTWNEQEKTWECPCHGTRLDRFGHLLDGPAQSGKQQTKHG